MIDRAVPPVARSLATMPGHRVEASRLVAVEPTVAFDRLMAARPTEVFSRGYAAFPAVREVTEEPDDWGTVGQTRTLRLADGGSLHQTITSVDRPHSYAYVLDDIHGRLRPFVRSVEGMWSITPKGDRCRRRLGVDVAPEGLAGASHHERDRPDVEGVRRPRPRRARDHLDARLTLAFAGTEGRFRPADDALL